jgi:hypothetical protein
MCTSLKLLFHFTFHVEHYYNLSPTLFWNQYTVLYVITAYGRNNLITPSIELFEIHSYKWRQIISDISFRSRQFSNITNETLYTTECVTTFLTALRVIYDSEETTLYNWLFLDRLLKNVLSSHPSGHDLTEEWWKHPLSLHHGVLTVPFNYIIFPHTLNIRVGQLVWSAVSMSYPREYTWCESRYGEGNITLDGIYQTMCEFKI